METTSLRTISEVGDSPKRRRVVDEGLQRTRSSSLLQMWRRIEEGSEVERKIKALKQQCSKPNVGTSTRTCETIGNIGSGSFSEGHSELKACVYNEKKTCPDIDEAEKSKAKQDSRDRVTFGARENSSIAPQLHEKSMVQSLGDNDYKSVRTVREWAQLTSQERGSGPYTKVSTEINPQTEMVCDGLLFNGSKSRPNRLHGKTHRICGKQTLVDLLLKAEKERQRELQDLTKRCAVSKFSHRPRIQSLLKSRFLRNINITNEKPKTRSTASRELEILKQRQTVSDRRDGFLLRTDSFARSQLDSGSGCMPSSTCTNTTSTKEEITNMTHEENIVAKDDGRILHLQSFDNVNSEKKASHASDESKDVVNECSVHMDTIIHDMSSDLFMETVDAHAPSLGTSQIDYAESILSESCEAQNTIEGEATRVSDASGGSKNNARTLELCELVGRRRVSNLLGSGFRENLNHLLLKHVERQARASAGWDHTNNVPSPASELMRKELDISSQNVASVSTSGPANCAEGPLQNILGEPLGIRDWDVFSNMRMDITTLQHRMNDMQRMLAACIDMQLELQRSIRLELAAALNGSISQASNGCCLAIDESKWELVRKGICCVCGHSSIDALLYRCGHMCACSRCANRLLEEKNKCPMCQSSILQVINTQCVPQQH